MLDFEKSLGRASIAFPMIHLISGGLYIAGYSFAFGGNIGGMFAASDIFTATIQHLIKLYFWGLAFPFIIILARHRLERYIKAQRAKEGAKNQQDMAVKREPLWPIWALAPFALGILFLQIWTGSYRDYYTLSLVFLMGLLPLFWKAEWLFALPRIPAEFAWCMMVFAVGVFSQGMQTGDRDRRAPYATFLDQRMRCDDHLILNPVGPRFLSVTPDNRRHLIDDQCVVKFNFYPTPVVPSQSPYQLAKAKFSGLLQRD